MNRQNKKFNYESLEKKIEKKYQKRSKKRQLKMKVSGASVKKLQKIIIKK